MQIIRFGATIFAVNIFRNIFHRPRPVERDKRNNIFQRIGLHGSQSRTHARAFQLKHTDCRALTQHFKGLFIVNRQLRHIYRNACLFNQSKRPLNYRQSFQSEKVEFYKSRRLDPFHIELGGRHIRAWIEIKRHQFLQWPVANHHPRRMGRSMTIKPFQF